LRNWHNGKIAWGELLVATKVAAKKAVEQLDPTVAFLSTLMGLYLEPGYPEVVKASRLNLVMQQRSGK